ncbi:TetR/AcrR family transcriptional regulator [Phaeobacter marinintestinus]|uniref:TetR/AcrR family transcriptional regulator n=1 Tax=Falsiphaeobacter marinintestinus TaxID=1492905 RepID=UPI0011B456D9|nr:TetR/AcrR family transcriptional regulator [Phaeobacter marinintestinus]
MAMTADIDALQKPKQARSRARRAALIEYGVQILGEKDLDELSIAEITRALGYSTGSFYSYFEDKTAFFIAVQQWVSDEQGAIVHECLEAQEMTDKTLSARLDLCVGVTLAYFRKRTGVIRSALRYERRIPEGWAPNRAMTQRVVAAVTVGLSAQDKQKLEIALQLAFGMLVNALLHDPGPLKLGDADLETKISAALGPYLNTT